MADDKKPALRAIAGGGAAAVSAPTPGTATGAPGKRVEVTIRKAQGPGDDKIHTWPHLVRSEFLMSIGILLLLTVWSLLVDAPLEEPGNPTRTPNPSKAPWYFLGLQEMLVFFDAWHAGVVLPSLIIVGLMVIPYIDINPSGNGYYTFKERKFELLTFFFGFQILWISLLIIGTFMRGPGWNWFWPWEPWDPHKVEALTNVDRMAEGQGVHAALGLPALLPHLLPVSQHDGGGGEDAPSARGQREVRPRHPLDQRLAGGVGAAESMFYLAKFLQAVGFADVGYSLFVGISQEDLSREYRLALIGIVIFYVGRLIEQRVSA
jgi:hypothetical protein